MLKLLCMTKIYQYVLNHKKYFFFGVIILAIAVSFIFAGQNKIDGAYTVTKTDVVQSVLLSGKAETSSKADLGFASSGRISRINVKNNQSVKAGQTLAQLEIGDLLAELKIKEINSKSSSVDLSFAKEDLEKVISQETAKVNSAYRAMLSEGLVLRPDSNSQIAKAPTVSGAYNGSEGKYKIIISKKKVTSNDYELRTFDLEKIVIDINKEEPTRLGTKGLYISFPDDLELYNNTIWYLEIPNKSSSSYLTNLNAYNEAKENKDRAIKSAETKYDKLLSEGNDGSGSAIVQAEIQKINAEIRKNTIYAPFSGIVTNIEKEVGENASVGERIISVLGEDKLQVVLKASELDVSKLIPDMPIQITFDSLPGEQFEGILKTVNSRDTSIDGIPTYEAFVELPADLRIKTGMSATGKAVIYSKNSVLAVPSYLIKKSENEGEGIVSVISPKGKTEDRKVTLGITGTDSLVEIISGLNEGEKLIAQ